MTMTMTLVSSLVSQFFIFVQEEQEILIYNIYHSESMTAKLIMYYSIYKDESNNEMRRTKLCELYNSSDRMRMYGWELVCQEAL